MITEVETIVPWTLPGVPFCQPDFFRPVSQLMNDPSFSLPFPVTAAVYFVIAASGTILYIGSTKDLNHRVFNHTFAGRFYQIIRIDETARIHWLDCADLSVARLRSLEEFCIRHFEPLLNLHHNPSGGVKATVRGEFLRHRAGIVSARAFAALGRDYELYMAKHRAELRRHFYELRDQYHANDNFLDGDDELYQFEVFLSSRNIREREVWLRAKYPETAQPLKELTEHEYLIWEMFRSGRKHYQRFPGIDDFNFDTSGVDGWWNARHANNENLPARERTIQRRVLRSAGHMAGTTLLTFVLPILIARLCVRFGPRQVLHLIAECFAEEWRIAKEKKRSRLLRKRSLASRRTNPTSTFTQQFNVFLAG